MKRLRKENARLTVAPNQLNREFTVQTPNTISVGDITYLPTGEGWLYLAVVLDLCSRAVVGWFMRMSSNERMSPHQLRLAARAMRSLLALALLLAQVLRQQQLLHPHLFEEACRNAQQGI